MNDTNPYEIVVYDLIVYEGVIAALRSQGEIRLTELYVPALNLIVNNHNGKYTTFIADDDSRMKQALKLERFLLDKSEFELLEQEQQCLLEQKERRIGLNKFYTLIVNKFKPNKID